jgi:hypothetical protein
VTVTMVGMAPTAVALLAAFDPLTEGIRNLRDSGNPPTCAPRWPPSWIGSDVMNRRPESPVSPSVP